MLTPDFLNYLEFNDVIKIYEQLNIDITADIITRIAQGEEITEVSRKQLEILKETNGTEIFNEALEKTSLLTAQTKEALKKTFETMAKEDIQGYKELYEYRNKPFKLSENQYKKLNQGLKQTNRVLRNFTNTIAFQSKQAYIDTIDKAYMKVVSGAFDYTSAINSAVDELAQKGITLKDKKGRNIQLEVAVRRNVMSGIRETANNLDRDIEEELGCDGYEVTAHTGARPEHAEAQGKQYALNKKDSKKYGVGLWKDVEDLWQEYNCRHSYFGIILGISEPQYDKKELSEMNNAKVILNGQEVPYYEATQKQRQLENAIRKQKRTVEILDKANKDSTVARSQLRKLQQNYTEFCKETGLEKDYSRMRVSKQNTVTKLKSKYTDITNNFNTIMKYTVKEQQYYQDENGNKYNIDNKNVKIKANQKEREVAKVLGKLYGGQVNLVPVVLNPPGIKTPDYMVNGQKFDLKEPTGSSKTTIYDLFKNKKKQANNFIVDIHKSGLDRDESIRQAEKIFGSKHREWIETIILMDNNEVFKILKRKQ